jgi:DNA-binding CsgD family transcriptional regulator
MGIAVWEEDWERADRLGARAIELLDETGDRHWSALARWYAGTSAVGQTRSPEAARRFQECLRGLLEIDDSVWLFKPLIGLADVAMRGQAADVCAKLLGAADGVLERTGARLLPGDVPGYDRAKAGSAAALSAEALDSARGTGKSLSGDRLLALAEEVIRAAEVAGKRPVTSAETGGLTAREREVLILMAQGETDRSIAEALFISHRTVNAHVAGIFRALEVHDRRGAVRRARQLGLV